MSHHVSSGLGAFLAATVFAIGAISAVTSGQAPLGRSSDNRIDRVTNPIFFWGYVLIFGGLAVVMTIFGVVAIVRAIFS